MIIDKDKKTVTFELEDKKFHILDLAQTMGEIDIDECFDDFIKSVAKKTLRSSINEMSGDDRIRVFDRELDGFRDVDQSIIRWANRKMGFPYEMIVAFFATCDEEYEASREKMKEYFVNNAKSAFASSVLTVEQRFLNIFRLMCTDSRGAYGQIFVYYQETDTVKICNRYFNNLTRIKESFTR